MLGDANQAECQRVSSGTPRDPVLLARRKRKQKGQGGKGTVGRQLIYACTSANVFTAISISEAEDRR